MSVGQELLNVPFPQMVLNLGMAIAEAQTALDQSSIDTLEVLAKDDNKITVPIKLTEKENGTFEKVEATMTLLQFGIMPTFYQFSNSIIEVKMAITMTRSTEFELGIKGKVGWGCVSASVNAKYSQKYSYKVEGSSLLRTTLVPVTPPPRLIREVIHYTPTTPTTPPTT